MLLEATDRVCLSVVESLELPEHATGQQRAAVADLDVEFVWLFGVLPLRRSLRRRPRPRATLANYYWLVDWLAEETAISPCSGDVQGRQLPPTVWLASNTKSLLVSFRSMLYLPRR